MLTALESRHASPVEGQPDQMTLFDRPPTAAVTPTPPAATPAPDEVRARLGELAPDDMSPREALDALYELKQLLEKT